MQPTCPRVPLDLSDNSARAQLLERLIDSVRAPSSPALAGWAMPCDPPPASTGGACVGQSWARLNQLRVLDQYARLLGELCSAHPFLQGAGVTCVLGLEWASGLLGPMRAQADADWQNIEKMAAFYASQRGVDPAEGLFHLHLTMPCYDRDVTRALLHRHFPRADEYELDVCRLMLRAPGLTYRAWLADFPRWRSKGLLYPLGVAALYMPELDDWLPRECHANTLAQAFHAFVQSVHHPGADPVPLLNALQAAWAADGTHTNLLLAHTLDRVAVLMRVKSNGRLACDRDFALQPALDAFPRSFGADPHDATYHAWHALKYRIEDAMPPSLLCAPLVRPKRATWGLSGLTLSVSPDGTVRFLETQLEPVGPAADTEVHTHTPPYMRHCLAFQTSARVQDVLWRLGEAVLSPGVAACMLRPDLAGDPAAAGEALAPAALLSSMRPLAGPAPEPYRCAMRALEATLPPVRRVSLPAPREALLWRLDIPNRAIVYLGTGDEVRPDSHSQHHLHKLLLNCKVPPCHVGGILDAAPGQRLTEDALRGALRSFAASSLDSHPSNCALVKVEQGEAAGLARQTTPVVSTTLAESVACFALTAPPKKSIAPLGKSCPWQENGIDPRYAERQDAANGFRYRDWAAMHAGRAGTQQSRLAAHALSYDALHLTAMPWIDGDAVRWVHVASTAPPVCRTLQGHSFRHAVESRFLHDPRMLPVRAEGQTVARSDAEIYADDADQLAIAYAPTDSDRIEMIAFRLAAN